MKKNEEGLIKDARESVLGEIQTLVTVGYIIAVGIGMLFTYQKYSHYGINIFDYAEIFDFLIAPFSDSKILIFTIVSVILGLFFIRIDIYWKKRFPESYSRMNFGMDKKSWFNPFRYLIYTVIVIYYLYLSSDLYGNIAKKHIETQNSIKIEFADGEMKKGILIGKTNNILFLKKGDTVSAIPISSLVKEIEVNNEVITK